MASCSDRTGLARAATNADNGAVTDAATADDGLAHGAHDAAERRERIRLETPRHRIEGQIVLAADGYRSRVSDVLNASERDFLTLTDATLQPLDGGALERHEFLAVARAHVVYVVAPGDRN
jgi:hypothetical protein